MPLFESNYDPRGTETYSFFGNPTVQTDTSPVECLFRDVGNVFVNSRLIFDVLATFWTERPIDELYLWATTVFSLVWFTFWSLMQTPVVFAALAAFLILVAGLSLLTATHDLAIWRIIQGPPIQVYPAVPPKGHNARQRWVYINGVATGKTITRQNLQALSNIFHNPVLAVNNRTYGFLGDILECIIQRAFGFRTKETGVACNIIKSYLQDDTRVDKVVLIAHSQGGIIASQILDDLFCDISRDHLAKLEVYTFGNAALKFNNPWKDKGKTSRVIPVIEHYCNEKDMVTSWGALSSVDRQDLPFVGKVFVAEGRTGHMLNQHYLKYMFTGPEKRWNPDNFQLRAVKADPRKPAKYHVTRVPADTAAGEKAVHELSKLWTYMQEP